MTPAFLRRFLVRGVFWRQFSRWAIGKSSTVLGIGCGVIFDVTPPKRPGDLPFATNVSIYEDEIHALVAWAGASAQAVEVEPPANEHLEASDV